MSYSDIAKRLKIAFGGIKGYEIAEKLGVTKATVSRYLSGKNMPDYDGLIKISEITGYSIDWLLTGKEPMKLSEVLMEKDKGKSYMPTPTVVILAPDELKIRMKELETRKFYIPVPLLPASIIIKAPINIEDKDIEGFALIYKSWLQQDHIYRCIKIKDNSMSPILEEGFIVAIDCSNNEPSLLEGKIVAARYQDSLAIRKLLLTNEYYILQPQNTLKFEPIKIPITEQNVIIGKIVCWFGKSKD